MPSVGGPRQDSVSRAGPGLTNVPPLSQPGGGPGQRGRLAETVGDCGWRTSISSGIFVLPAHLLGTHVGVEAY